MIQKFQKREICVDVRHIQKENDGKIKQKKGKTFPLNKRLSRMEGSRCLTGWVKKKLQKEKKKA